MSELEKKVKQLRKTIFNMLNYANMYVLVLDESMIIRYANTSLANDLGFKSYTDLVGKCWIDFLIDEEKEQVQIVHNFIADGSKNWEKYKEFKNHIKTINGEIIFVHWFNSHINTDYNWSFSFGIRKNPQPTMVSMDSIRKYYKDIIDNDRTMIESMRDFINSRDNRLINTCEPSLF